MSAKILFEIWNEDASECVGHTAFDTVDVFLIHARALKAANTQKHLRAHIPGGFPLTSEDVAEIDALGIVRI